MVDLDIEHTHGEHMLSILGCVNSRKLSSKPKMKSCASFFPLTHTLSHLRLPSEITHHWTLFCQVPVRDGKLEMSVSQRGYTSPFPNLINSEKKNKNVSYSFLSFPRALCALACILCIVYCVNLSTECASFCGNV